MSIFLYQLLFIALGGAFGALSRFGLSQLVYQVMGRGYPWGTLTVNILGSFCIGFLYIFFESRLQGAVALKQFLMVGFLGALTTFSTFSLDSLLLIENGFLLKAVVNLISSVLLCLFAVWLGTVISRLFFN